MSQLVAAGFPKIPRVLLEYYQERFTLFPWCVLPLFLALLFHEKLNSSGAAGVVYLLFSILFFRLFDDLMTEEYDERQSLSRRYLQNSARLRLGIIIPFFLFIVSTFLFRSIEGVILTGIFLLLQVGLYRMLKESELCQLVSLLKYPFFEFIWRGEGTVWGLGVFLAFLWFDFRDIFGEKALPPILRQMKLRYTPFFILLICRLLFILNTTTSGSIQ
jgi:hypothetical protein